ncbi:MAG: DUF4388 domain-containing protein [candidate division WOR-3 bacterium]
MRAEISYISVVEVLHFLSINKKTGKIKIKSRYEGEIYVEEGKFTHAIFNDLEGIDALFELSLLKEGYLTFEPNVLPPKKTMGGEPVKLFEEFDRRSKEIREIENKLPPLDAVLLKSENASFEKLKLRKSDWKILSLIDGKKKLRDVIFESQIGLFEAYKSVSFLIEKGLIFDPEEEKRRTKKIIQIFNEFINEYSKDSVELKKSCTSFIKTALKSSGFKELEENIDFDEKNGEIFLKKESIIGKESFKNIKEVILPLFEKKFILDFGTILGKKKFENFKRRIETLHEGI